MSDRPVRPSRDVVEDPPTRAVFVSVGPNVGAVMAGIETQTSDDHEDMRGRSDCGVKRHPSTGPRRAPMDIVLGERILAQDFCDWANTRSIEDIVDGARAVL